jgi:hypothetical protein
MSKLKMFARGSKKIMVERIVQAFSKTEGTDNLGE